MSLPDARSRIPLAGHLTIVSLLGILAGILLLQAPSLGDDLGYWRLAVGFHGPYGEA